MGRPRATALLLLALVLAGAPARAQSGRLFARAARPAHAPAAGPAAAWLRLDRAALDSFRGSPGGRLELPLPDGTVLALALERFEVLAPNAVVTLTGPRGPVPYRPDLALFRGGVEGEPGSLAVIAVSGEEVSGTIERASGRLALSPVPHASRAGVPGAAAPDEADHAVSAVPDQPPPGGSFTCPSDDLPRAGAEPPAALPALPEDVEATTTRLVCDVALDCDNEFFVLEGADSARAVSYALTMLGTASAVYEREINVSLRASYLNVWTGADPYAATDLSGALAEFRTWWNANRAGVPRDLAQLVSGRPLGGGVAWIGVLCNSSSGYSLIGSLSGRNTYPQNGTTWDVEVMAHELGHNFNSNHTHSCWWQSHGYAPAGALLDSCYAAEGTCYSGPTGLLPADLGTIMSYCHLISSMNGIRLDFHPACRSVMRAAAEAASCLTADPIQPPANVAVATGPAGASLTWTASPTPGVLRYDVFRSLWQQDLAPALLGTTTGTSFTDLDLGTFWYKVRAVRAADSSAFSGEAKALVCGPSAPATYAVGMYPAGVLAADFDEDGILDLAVSNVSSNSVSVLRGQGAGGAGDGTFAAAVSVTLPAGSYPVGMTAGDWNGDGILDLAVANNGTGLVTLLLGQGSGGVGDGTFAVGSSYPVAAGAWAVVHGDFDADGIADLAVAGTGGQVSILLGQGLGGIPNGAFGPRTDYALGAAAYALATADFDEDGILDLAAATNAGASVLRGHGADGRGDGTFGEPALHACGASPYALATGDFDADGRLDLAVANAGSASVSILLGTGDGSFAPAAAYPCGSGPVGLVVGDWNGDGVPDLAVPNGTVKTVSFLTGHSTAGRADGTFDAPQTFPAAGTAARALAAGDFDHDGQADLAVVNRAFSGQVAILRASCASPLPATLAVAEPALGETWVTGTARTIRWSRGPGILAVDVALSRDGGANWETIAGGLVDTSWTWNVCGPYAASARIEVFDPAVPGRAAVSDSFTIVPVERLDVAAPAPVRLALAGARPNPARGAARVWFSLADGSPARLELLDLAGRRLRSIEVGRLGPGFHGVDLDESRSLAPGLYLLRLTQAGRHVAGKIVLAR